MPKAKVRRVARKRVVSRPVAAPPGPDEWERGWQRTWKKLGFVPYELPADDSPAGQEREFLTRARTADGERERLSRIQEEFERGFRALGRLGPAVTVFGSARFEEGHRYYELAREVGRELARAGFVTITGGGPGIMEAANRGAHEAGGPSVGLNILLPHEQGANPYVDVEHRVPLLLRAQGHAREVLVRLHRDAGRSRHARRALRGGDPHPVREDRAVPARAGGEPLLGGAPPVRALHGEGGRLRRRRARFRPRHRLAARGGRPGRPGPAPGRARAPHPGLAGQGAASRPVDTRRCARSSSRGSGASAPGG